MKTNYYKEILGINNMPKFLYKYLSSPSLLRLKKVGYFCGMDYASKNIYDFSEYISRFDHSLTVALLVYKLTKNKLYTIMGLIHDIATPCFSHVIDYMNEDYEKQESTEEYTEKIILEDDYLLKCLKEDNISPYDIIDFKKCSIVDNKRPKLCADRLDGVILTAIGWTKNITKEDTLSIIRDITVFNNEDNELEIGFRSASIATTVVEISKSIDYMCHSNEDNYMMNLLANITKMAIKKRYITYLDLFLYNEEEVFSILDNIKDKRIKELLNKFKNIEINKIPNIKIDNVKKRRLHPLVNGVRIK